MDTSLVIIRHAETLWNQQGRMQGFQDSPLSETGIEQSRRLGVRLRRRPFGAAVSSDSGRCLETFRLALDGTGVTPVRDERFRERNLGEWEGRTWKELAAAYPDDARRYRSDPDFRPPKGESFLELQKRALDAINDILREHSGRRVAVFTSGGTLRAAVLGALGIDPTQWPKWAVWNTGLTRLDYRDGQWKLVKYNDAGHLSGTEDGRAVF